MVIDTDVRFNSLFSSLRDPKKVSELRTECEKVLSPRGVSLLFQLIASPLFSNINQNLLQQYMGYMIGKLK